LTPLPAVAAGITLRRKSVTSDAVRAEIVAAARAAFAEWGYEQASIRGIARWVGPTIDRYAQGPLEPDHPVAPTA